MDYEKLGAFYLGRLQDTQNDLLLYDSSDLTTHAMCVGMTGSGKSGLCISLLEEAAIDGIPAIAIDPKGDLGNLLLGFPKLQPADFRPWIDVAEAARDGQTPDEAATAAANLWRKGLGKWGQDGKRIAKLHAAADFAIYTPGSNAGLPLTVLRSFAAPPPALVDDADAFRERIASAVSGLLALLGIDADPIRSREHILLSTILDRTWRDGKDLDIAGMIGAIQNPPFERIGVMDLESFFPGGDRFGLAMSLNNLLASPGFSAWNEGEPLDIPRLLWTAEGKPRVAILSIAHLSEAERMFFVTTLLNEVVSWMRTQSGTSSLRALLYMDEVFGYFPPVANPPSKRPMLTLLKQARAYGLGVVLATQNPVDLDYKGLSNCGTWFIGRLQTERDKARVLEGLEGASATTGQRFDRGRMEETLAGLGKRVFLMNNVHEDEPVVFHTRWAMSYLRGPLTRDQIKTLMHGRKQEAAPTRAAARPKPVKAPKAEPKRPTVPADVPEYFLPGRRLAGDARLVYRPALVAAADLHWANVRAGVDEWASVACLAPITPSGDVWDGAKPLGEVPELDNEPEDDAADFAKLPTRAKRAKTYTTWTRSFKTHLYKNHAIELHKCKELKLTSKPGETEAEFRVRVREASREKRDLAVAKLRKRYTPKLQRMQDRIRRAEEKVEREQAQVTHKKTSTAISLGTTILGAIFGRKIASRGNVGRAATTARSASGVAKEKQDVVRAKENVRELQRQLEELERDFENDMEQTADLRTADEYEFTKQVIHPRKTDIAIDRVALAWTPWHVDESGIAEPAF